MLKYGNDKPDLRNPIENADATDCFANSGFSIFANAIKSGSVVRAIPAPDSSEMPRSFFDDMIAFAQQNGAKGLAYIVFDKDGTAKGPIAKLLTADELQSIKSSAKLQNGDSVFFSCGEELQANKLAGLVRTQVGKKLSIIKEDEYKFCWVVDFPYFEWNEDENKIDFSHNPFSMPKGGIAALQTNNKDELLKIEANQYDIVCNGIELSSGAIRNHSPEIMYRAFEIAGYSKEQVDAKFGGMIKAFKFGAPPHGGFAPGIDRIVMLIAGTENIRDIIAFPMNGKAEDLLMGAPSTVTEKQLRELHIKAR
jgi:aspartyl-tRNA synthetase